MDTSHFEKCKEIMLRHKRNFKLRFFLLLCILIMNFFVQMHKFVTITANFTGFHMGLGAIVLSVLAVAFGSMASSEHPKFLTALLILLAFGMWRSFFNPYLGGLLFVLYFMEIPECYQANWVMQQPGYPYFNERFEEQKRNANHSTHKTDNVPDMYDSSPKSHRKMDSDIDIAIENMRKRQQDRKAQEEQQVSAGESSGKQYSIRLGETEDTMPGVMLNTPEKTEDVMPDMLPDAPEKTEDIMPGVMLDIPERTENDIPDHPKKRVNTSFPEPEPFPVVSLPEPELPKVEEILMPVWDVPEPTFPDPVTDTSVILSDFPEINDDIPDLPEIPDIPKL